MVSLLAPGYLFAALAAAAALVAAHFIVRRQPRALALPTARFVPDVPALTTGWARVPSDLLLLALRVLSVLLTGIALAGPLLQQRQTGTTRVILVDRSRAVADINEVRDSVAAIAGARDVVVEYARTARAQSQADLGSRARRQERGSLSAGLVAAIRAASAFRDRADSVELVVVSAFAAEQLDAATARVRREWPGRARLVRVSPADAMPPRRVLTLPADTGDAFAVAVRLARAEVQADARVARGVLTAADSAWVGAEPGRVLVHWPRTAMPAGFIVRAQPSPTQALLAEGSVLVAPFQREWQYVPAQGSAPVAWWMDGAVAAAESPHGSGCVRSVSIPVSATGDFVLRRDFHAVLRDLLQPCGGVMRYESMPAQALAMLRGTGRLASASAFSRAPSALSPLSLWLLLAALACALLELVVRRRLEQRTTAPASRDLAAPARKVA